ncbi:MAG: STAS domain-containing protein [Vampirovibrionales bacterium]|nr:STAS domain-containing protein [Vampirovibrionales bacterium]
MTVAAAIAERIIDKVLVLDLPDTIHQEPLHRAAAGVSGRGLSGLLINMSSVSFIESSGLGTLVAAFKTCQESGVPMAITGIQPYVQKLVAITKLDRILKVFATEADALAYLSQ